MKERTCNHCRDMGLAPGRIPCPRCQGTRRLCGEPCYHCSDGTNECPVCRGSGKVPEF